MILPDVNVLVYAYRDDLPQSPTARAWFAHQMNYAGPVAIADVVLSGFVRVATNPRAFARPMSIETATEIVQDIRAHSRTVHLAASQRQWQLFVDLCLSVQATGKLVPDAYIASLAIANGCELATSDRDFRRFPGLRTVNPLA